MSSRGDERRQEVKKRVDAKYAPSRELHDLIDPPKQGMGWLYLALVLAVLTGLVGVYLILTAVVQ